MKIRELNRYRTKKILKDLDKKMVFLVGPRQVGKTWLSKKIGERFKNTVYLNYDNLEDRKIILNKEWLEKTDLLILDELHKMPDWKNFLKGVYDTKEKQLKILVTGSARLETFRQTGDSLAGRFFVHHLLPFSPFELNFSLKNIDGVINKFIDLDRLVIRGGFPEPFLASNETEANRWRKQYVDSLIREDVLSFEKIDEMKALREIFELLQWKVGSPLSYSSIARDVGLSSATVKKYIQVLESLFIIFIVRPYTNKISRSILKEPKIYFFDTGLVKGKGGAKVENLVAVSLLKYIFLKNDYLGKSNRLGYLRTKEGKEVDFVLVDSNNKAVEIIEVKNKQEQLVKNLIYFSEKYNVSATQLSYELKQERQISKKIKIQKISNYLRDLKV